MRFASYLPAILATLIMTAVPAQAAKAVKGPVATEVIVDVSKQEMIVKRHGKRVAKWPVSTARKGKITPRGSWSPNFLSRHHKSSRYKNAPMPCSIFYSGNFAVHGTNAVSKLGSPASAGCVRLETKNACQLFDWVAKEGKRSMRVTVKD